MPVKKYTEEQKKFIAENVKGATTKQLVKLVNDRFGLNISVSAMKSYKANHKLKSGTSRGGVPGRETKLFPKKIKEFIKENYIGTGHREMAERLNNSFETQYTVEQIKGYYARFKLDSGLTGRFSKGHVPANKGMKGTGGWEPTQFRKGNVPINHKPVGSERINVYGYAEIKVAEPNYWRLKHHVIWEEHNGPKPKGHKIIFGDRNPQNLSPDNLILVSNRQMATLNKKNLIQKDVDLTRTGIIMADIYQQISRRKKG